MSEEHPIPEFLYNYENGPRLVFLSEDGLTTASIFLDSDGLLKAKEKSVSIESAKYLEHTNGSYGGMALNDHFIAFTTEGNENWTTTAYGNSAGTYIVESEVSHPGIIKICTGKSEKGRASHHQSLSSIMFGDGTYVYNTCIRVPVLSSPSDSFRFWTGFCNTNASGDMSDGVYFFGENGSLYMKTSDNSLRVSKKVPNFTQTTEWMTLTIVVHMTSVAKFYINGQYIDDILTNIPETRSTGILAKVESTLGTSPKCILVDATSVSYQP